MKHPPFVTFSPPEFRSKLLIIEPIELVFLLPKSLSIGLAGRYALNDRMNLPAADVESVNEFSHGHDCLLIQQTVSDTGIDCRLPRNAHSQILADRYASDSKTSEECCSSISRCAPTGKFDNQLSRISVLL